MDQFLLQEALKLNKKRKRRQRWQKVVSAMAATVVFCTTYALILPAITMEHTPICGIEAHEHTEQCFAHRQISEMRCEAAEHIHDESCADELGNYQCGYGAYILHSHGESCVDQQGELICPLEERESHFHGEDCSVCIPACTLDEVPAHWHDPSCYGTERELCCGEEEYEAHVHAQECYEQESVLICAQDECLPHSHDELCYAEDDQLVCGQEETAGHIHEEECYTVEDVLLCQAREGEGHLHEEGCFRDVESLICPLEETPGHTHVETCLYDRVELICTLSEVGTHTHDERCYGEDGGLICPVLPGVVHDHSEACTVEVREETYLICELEEHIHEDACYPAAEGREEAEYLCGFSEHTHNELCAQTSEQFECNVPEHIHSEDCLVEEEIPADGALPPEEEGVLPEGEEIPAEGELIPEPPVELSESQLEQIEQVILAIDGLPTADEIDAEIEAFEAAEDYEGEEVWLGQLYERVGEVYRSYERLDANQRELVTNGDKLMELEYIWSMSLLASTRVYLDGTDGGLMALGGSPAEWRYADTATGFVLPETWPSPEKYSYKLNGWYDVKSGRWYKPGATASISGETIFYADWIAASYDVGRNNNKVADTVSTSEFITTHMFDYNSLFNTLSENNNYTSGNSTTWTLVEDGTVKSTGKDTLDFIFVDHDREGRISMPVGRNQSNGVDYSIITYDLYSDYLADLLFDPNKDVIGKHYIGTADHLFQYGADPSDEDHYGYYYYDSHLNAASYNQSDGRFYVYDYLERTADSANNDSYADFLPLNSPYANTNGNSVATYYYNGYHGEYGGVTHYQYDAKYSDSNNSADRVGTNYAFGMATDLEFYLPAKPGTLDAEGEYANQSITGDDMIFEFSGDDDVWVLIDGELVLDIGGIHGVEEGYIDFSTGEVVSGEGSNRRVTKLDIEPGTHILTMYYLERGASMSNFKLRFNLTTRYSMTLTKEDVLNAKLLDGAQFAVYTDKSCAKGTEAELWVSKESHDRKDDPTHIFEVKDGEATMWGFAAGNTYYMVEVVPPTGMKKVDGIVRIRLNNQGQPDYEVLPDADKNLTVGYTAHGYKVDEETQQAYLVITNTDAVGSKPMQVYVEKVWSDGKSHSGESITVYLMAGKTRIQSVTLNEYNDWKHTWVNLPSTYADGTPVTYTVREATVPGYVGKVEEIGNPNASSGTGGSFEQVSGFSDGKTYLLHTSAGYLSAVDGAIFWEGNRAAAESSLTSKWTADVNGSFVTLTNQNGQTLQWREDQWAFSAVRSPTGSTDFQYTAGKLHSYKDFGNWQQKVYFQAPVNNNVIYGVGEGEGLTFTLYEQAEAPPAVDPDELDEFYRITNTPAGAYTVSLTVNKKWDLGNMGQTSMYEDRTIWMKLMTDGHDSGLAGELSKKNGWEYTFTNLPMYDSGGDEIEYTVEEIPFSNEWVATYGPVTETGNGKFTTTVTNTYIMTYMLPETGGVGYEWYTMLGALLLCGAAGGYCGLWRKRKGGEI